MRSAKLPRNESGIQTYATNCFSPNNKCEKFFSRSANEQEQEHKYQMNMFCVRISSFWKLLAMEK